MLNVREFFVSSYFIECDFPEWALNFIKDLLDICKENHDEGLDLNPTNSVKAGTLAAFFNTLIYRMLTHKFFLINA